MSVILSGNRFGRIEYYQAGGNGLWYWRYRAKNGLIQMDGAEGYASRSNVLRAIKRLVNRDVLNFYIPVVQVAR